MINKIKIRNKGFSLLELMITVTVAGIIAAFAIPNYRASLDRANEKDIINQMKIIHAAQNSFFSRNNSFYNPTPATNVTAINTNLNINIITRGNTYDLRPSGSNYLLTVTNGTLSIQLNGGGWDPKYKWQTPGAGNPFCTGACPTLQ